MIHCHFLKLLTIVHCVWVFGIYRCTPFFLFNVLFLLQLWMNYLWALRHCSPWWPKWICWLCNATTKLINLGGPLTKTFFGSFWRVLCILNCLDHIIDNLLKPFTAELFTFIMVIPINFWRLPFWDFLAVLNTKNKFV